VTDGDEADRTTISDIEVSLTARSKSGRYLAAPALKQRLRSLHGTLFQTPDGEYRLRTPNPNRRSGKPLVIVFVVEDTTATILTQTSDHYDWSVVEHVQSVPFEFEEHGE
jgi:hypothetical protein